MNELQKRIMSGVIGVLLLIFLIIKNGIYYKIALFAISLIALYEFKKAVYNSNIELSAIYLILSSLSIFYEIVMHNTIQYSLILVIVLTALNILTKEDNLVNSACSLFAIIYLSYNFMLMGTIEHKVIQGLIFVIAFSTDTFAYIFGMNFGKNKLCPTISPNKSVEGAIGGVFGCIIVCFIYLKLLTDFNILKILGVAIAGSIVSQLGDLTASRIKRANDIKDFGYIIPGHGGIMDRFDSVILVAPTVYFVIYGLFNGGY
ncbi:MAG: phosphatidate cytidylyltransferase [Tissierellia bacterium]|nr:phosphatidate cytidylyltransferase [Tissierellia bacterium]